jgi:transposase
VRKELKKHNVTLRLLWEEYREAHPDGYSYSQYCELYRQYVKKLDPPMRQKHKAGEKMFVDYAGDTIPITDPETGEVWPAQIFMAVLGASNYTYAEAQASQDLPNWIGGHVRALAFFGGATQIIVPDNLLCKALHNRLSGRRILGNPPKKPKAHPCPLIQWHNSWLGCTSA